MSRPPSPITTAAMAASLVLALAAPAAAETKNWSIEYESSLEGTNNLEQHSKGSADLTWRNNLELSYFPAADADNSALFKFQALGQRYYYNPDFDSTYLIGTALGSRRIHDSLFGYGGGQVLFKQGTAPNSNNATDADVFGGLVQYLPVGNQILVFHGYQFDYLRAAVSQTSYQGHSLYVTGRHVTTDRWTNSLTARSQLRLFDVVNQIEWRNQLQFDSDYRVFDWWTLEGEAIYVNSTNTAPGFSFGAWNLGVFSRFSL